ncbi:ras and Rab interactor 1 [Ornithorhynchus anatinus]|uniref:Ras and Rab interactor 1 n=1 Tax=Ornithorhynchus anatinus TaxID=9258 RepID=F7ANP1_ORNAN|nr:ras and Rab interactor 1 [Ornithorhynchus anatinus]
MEVPGEPAVAPQPPRARPGASSRATRDPIYDVPEARGGGGRLPSGAARPVSLRERLLLTQPVWHQLRANPATALHTLQREPPGTFLVRKSTTRQRKVLCVRLPEASGPSFVANHDIRETPGVVSLEGSELVFPDLIQLVSSYCHIRDILLLPLQLPRAIRHATTLKELEAISHLGMEFWSSSLNTKDRWGPAAPAHRGPRLPQLKPRSPEELDQGNRGALCFFNPLFPGDLGPARREKFRRSFKVRVSTETSSPLSPPAVPPPPVPTHPGGIPAPTEGRPPHRPLRRESSGGYRVPAGTTQQGGPPLPSLPSLQEVDSGSPSSSEEEEEESGRARAPSPPGGGRRGGRRRQLLRSMSDAVCSLLAPERQVGRAVGDLARDRRTTVGQLLQDLLTRVRARQEPQELGKIRQELDQAKALLSAELAPEKLLTDKRLDRVLEKALHRSILKPLRPILLARLRLRFTADGSLRRLADGLRLARLRGPGAFGLHPGLPAPAETERIRQKLQKLLRAYSPSAKVTFLLQACKLLYAALRSHAGDSAGADEFLPLLSYVLARCDLPDLLLEVEFMSELLEPALLMGEGGYYLTSLSASLTLLGDLTSPSSDPTSPSLELLHSLSLWQHHQLPATRDLQHLLRVAYQDPDNGCLSKTLALPLGASAAALTQLCAAKFRVSRPEAFALFLYNDGGYRLLSPGTLPHSLEGPGQLVYRQAEGDGARADGKGTGELEEKGPPRGPSGAGDEVRGASSPSAEGEREEEKEPGGESVGEKDEAEGSRTEPGGDGEEERDPERVEANMDS